MYITDLPFRGYFDLAGAPLDSGYLYFGQPNQNPETAPITVYWDAAGTQPALQPIRTTNGLVVHNGAIANLFVAGNYSMAVRDRNNTLVFYAPTADRIPFQASLAAPGGAALIGWVQSGAGAVARLAQDKLRERVSVQDFGAVGDGFADDTAAIQAALNTGKSVCGFSGDTYLVAGLTNTFGNRTIDFGGALLKLKLGGAFILKTTDVDNVVIRNARLDMSSVVNAKGIWHNGGWNLIVENISSNALIANTAASSNEIYIDVGTRGAYVSSYKNIAIKNLKVLGTSLATNAVTTINFHDLQITSGVLSIAEAFGINFYSPVIQTTTSAFVLTNCKSIASYGGDIEGVTNLVDASGSGVSDVSVIGENSSTEVVLGTIGGRYVHEPFSTGTWTRQFTVSPRSVNTVDAIYPQTVIPAGAGIATGRQVFSGSAGAVNTTGLIWEYVSTNSIGPLVARYALRVNHGDQLLENFVILNDQLAVGNNPGNPTAGIDTTQANIRIRQSKTPASATAAGNAGEICWDASFIYVCVAANSWKRSAIAAW